MASVNALNPWKDSTLALNSSLARLRSFRLPKRREGLLGLLQLEAARRRRCGGTAAPSDAVDVERSRVDMVAGCGSAAAWRLLRAQAPKLSLALAASAGVWWRSKGSPAGRRARVHGMQGEALRLALRDAPSRDASTMVLGTPIDQTLTTSQVRCRRASTCAPRTRGACCATS